MVRKHVERLESRLQQNVPGWLAQLDQLKKENGLVTDSARVTWDAAAARY
eukprot:SAG22_NODE_8802_length_629_cov_0.722642_1_plen_49_part_10